MTTGRFQVFLIFLSNLFIINFSAFTNNFYIFTVTGDISRVAAEAALQAAVKKSEELGVKMNIAVVDNGANLVGFLR